MRFAPAAPRRRACSGASDKAACAATLAGLAPESTEDGWYGRIGPRALGRDILVYSRGDEVGALRSKEAVAAFLGLAKARLALETAGPQLVCTTEPAKSGWRQNADGSYEFFVSDYECDVGGSKGGAYRFYYRVASDGTVTGPVQDPNVKRKGVCGRRPDGLASVASPMALGLAAHFAEAAYLEAASVVAFRRLEEELHRLGAPAGLVARARRSRRDEIQHALETAAIARRYGAIVPPIVVAEPPARERYAIALENVVEGCVRETYGALVAAFQAERCAPEHRAMFERIAADELRHAELAHDVARWMEPQLTVAERTALADARTNALRDLHEALAVEPHEDVRRVAGMPSTAEARLLLAGLDEHLLSAA